MKSIVKNFIFLAILLAASISATAQKEINQYNPEALYERGVLLFENKHYASALECFEQYLSTIENDNRDEVVMAKYYEAVSALFLNDIKGENKLITFVKENPTCLMADKANLLYANTLFNKKKYRNALSTYQSINKNNLNQEEQDECTFKQAYCYYQTQNISKATPLFRELVTRSNAFQNDARYYYAHILYINKNREESLKHFNILKDSKKYKDVSNIYILQINFDNGNYKTVTDNGDPILEKANKNRKSDIAFMIAEAWFQQGYYTKSLEYYDIAVTSSRRKLPREIDFKVGFCKMKNNDYKGAIEHFAKVTDKNDKLGQYGSYYLAQCYTNTNQDKFARNTFFKAYKMNFNDTISANALFNYAALSFIPGIDPFNETVNVINEYIKNNPESSQAIELQEIVIHLLLNSNDYSSALVSIEQYDKLSPELKKIQSQLTYNVGIQYYNDGRYKDAIDFLSKSSKNKDIESESQKEALYWLADSYYQIKDYNNALKNYSDFIKSSGSEKLEVYPLAYYNIGYIHLINQDFENSSINFKKFLNLDKSLDHERQSDAWMCIGDCYFIQRQYNNAITSYSNAYKASNKNADYAYFQQAMGYGALGKTSEKINCLNIIVSKFPKSSFYDKSLYEIGLSYLSTNDSRSAITYFDKVVKERPRSQYARKSMMKTGMIYYNNDENDKALENLKEIVKKYPNTEESREALNIISNIYRDQNDIESYFDYISQNNLEVISIDKQDSLTFRNIEDFYSSNNYRETIKGANKYIEKHPNGTYLLKVHYYAMKSLENLNETEGIRNHIEHIINQPNNDYTDNALLLVARMDYDESNYSASAKHYERLLDITENQYITTEAIEGSMKSYYFDKQYDKAIEKANQLIGLQDISANQRKQANYILGKSFFDKADYAEAVKYFDACSNIDKTEIGAECSYLSAISLYNLKKYDDAEEKVFYTSDNYGNYIDWTALSFIALSDVYVAKDNNFQAKETLKSVIENYPKDNDKYNDIVKKAKEKLNIIDKTTNE